MKILLKRRNETIEYAAEELKKYITVMSRGLIAPTVSENGEDSEGIVLGLLSDLSLDESDLFDAVVDDIIDVSVKDGIGYIAGSNERSILYGVYKYCASLGCRYLRPGPDGDYIPKADIKNHTFIYRKKADSPIRCEIVEGAVSYEHCRDTVLFLPKIYMNAYMIEGYVPYTYMHKWYGHIGNTRLRRKGQVTSYDMLSDYVRLLMRDVKKTGLQLHTLGHGWMFDKFGIVNGAHTDSKSRLTEEAKKYVALVNGKRELFGNSTFYTHFCYSNPEARKILVDTVVDYAKKNAQVDYVHIWLADATNNWCECEACQEFEPSDHYVRLLNEIDEALTDEGLDTRIVMIMYVETVRPPKILKLNNPSRFLMTVAIGNHYENGYNKVETDEEIPPYTLNKFKPFSAPLQLKCHDEWKKKNPGMRSSVFEYRFYIDHYADLGYMQISRETYRDMRSLCAVGFDGIMTDKTHRSYMPTALPLIMMGHTMFDHNLDFDQTANEYFEGAFGKDGVKCREYLEKLSSLLSASNFRISGNLDIDGAGVGQAVSDKETWRGNSTVKVRALEIPSVVDKFIPTIEDNISSADDNARLYSWIYLSYHAEIVKLFSKILYAGASGDMDKAREEYKALEEYIARNELSFHRAFDGFLYLRYLRQKLSIDPFPYYD